MRVYKIGLENTAVTGAITLVQLKAGSTCAVMLLRAYCSQSNQTSVAMQPIEIVRKSGAATVTSGTPLLVDPGDSAAASAGGTSATGTNASSEGTDGDILLRENFDVLNPWIWLPTPEERIIVAPSGIIGLKFPIAPGSSMTVSAGFYFAEIG